MYLWHPTNATIPRRNCLDLRNIARSQNLLKKWQGVQDTALAAEGIVQAQDAAVRLAASGLRFRRTVSSDLRRARQTAEILSAACSCEDASSGGNEIRLDERLRECSLGRFEGMKRDDIKGPNGQYRSLFDELVRPWCWRLQIERSTSPEHYFRIISLLSL